MYFATAVRTCFNKYADFSGRARRSEYWWFALFAFGAGIVANTLDRILGTGFNDDTSGLITTVLQLALLLPSLAVGARRLHDTGRSGWLLLLAVIPILGWIILIVWFATDSKPGDNKHGPNPKSEGSPAQGYGQAPPSGPTY